MAKKVVHPEEMELVRFSDEEAGERVAAHVRWCARCRSAVADYRWLQEELEGTLATVAGVAPVPRSGWWAVQAQLVAGRRQAARWRVSAVSGLVLAICLMLSLPPILGPAVAAQAVLPQALIARAPVTAPASGSIHGTQPAWGATPTPVVSCQTVTPLPTPALMLPPTPEREA